jgi:hypothetical protein
MVVKYNPGVLLPAGGCSGGFGTWDFDRPITLAGFLALAKGENDIGTIGARLRSGSEIEHQLAKEFGAGKLDGIDFQGVPADETQEAGYGFRRLDAARAALEQTQADG